MTNDSSRRIAILREDVSRKIAAGEVIDRPFSVLRELLDNAIDAGARNIELEIEGGGQARIRVVDDGEGMSREDLALCWQRHATSKIKEEGDLYRVRTLGFRGEALSSIAACSRLTVVSRLRELGSRRRKEANRLVVEGGRELLFEEHQGPPGTVVEVADLFFNLPARRRFLKSPAAESALCRQAFLEKALPHPQVTFRYLADGQLKHFFPALVPEDYRDRVATAFGFDQGLVYGIEGGEEGLRIRAVVGRPELTRRDRKMVQIYVNRRRIFEYGLVQAAEYAYSEYVPGGHHPVVFLFLEVDPAEVDFNIHPAKREARFRDLPAVRRLVAGTLREFLKVFDLRLRPGGEAPAAPPSTGEQSFSFPTTRDSRDEQDGSPPLWESLRAGRRAEIMTHRGDGEAETSEPFGGAPVAHPSRDRDTVSAGDGRTAGSAEGKPVYRGQLFRLFLLVEHGDRLYIVDQHAAHERVLFEEMRARRPVTQELLMPIRVEGGRAAAKLLDRSAELLERLGIRLQVEEDGSVEIVALPEELLALDEDELVEALLWERASLEELEDRILSLAACRLAVKEGEELDAPAAAELARRVFALDNARCPHGRPIWTELSRKELEREVGRE